MNSVGDEHFQHWRWTCFALETNTLVLECIRTSATHTATDQWLPDRTYVDMTATHRYLHALSSSGLSWRKKNNKQTLSYTQLVLIRVLCGKLCKLPDAQNKKEWSALAEQSFGMFDVHIHRIVFKLCMTRKKEVEKDLNFHVWFSWTW